ncbi:MAG TPA: dihydrodipicolinate synthase family protein [Vicinamibacterales bacterium]
MDLTGVFAPLPTPFDENDRVDPRRLRSALQQWVATPLNGFVVLGTNGEIGLLADDECDLVVETARTIVPEGRPLIAGAGRESTQATIRAVRRAASLGADAVLVRTPAFFKAEMTHDNLARFYGAVADASPVPVLLYNFTAVTGVNLLPAAVARLATHPNIIGIKESGGDIAQVADLVSSTPPDFNVLAGSAGTFYPALCVGAAGGILALGNALPDACVRLYELTRAGRHEEALALQRELVPIGRMLGPTYGVAGLKAALNLLGYDVGVPRPPLVPVADSVIPALRDALARFEEIPA